MADRDRRLGRIGPQTGTRVRDALLDDGLAVAVMDALTSNICVVDPSGLIIAVNRAWMEFSGDNGGSEGDAYVGINYLNVCRSSVGPASDEAADFHSGLKAVLEGQRDLFQLEYPCHSPTELRWFLARATPLRRRTVTSRSGSIGAVVSHMDITDRKLIELNYARLASTDPLTGIPNRRFFEESAGLELQRLRLFDGPVCLLLLDLDHFKDINDAYGHATGDMVLRRVASCLQKNTRATDFLARLGGEEFVALLPGTDMAGALIVAENLRQAVERLDLVEQQRTVRVTLSIGVASMLGSDPTVWGAVNRADEALYRAKKDGRNCVRS